MAKQQQDWRDLGQPCHSSRPASLLERIGSQPELDIKVGCRGGGCGVCKVKIVKGEFYSKAMSKAHITDDERNQGIMLACRVFPTGTMHIDKISTGD